MRSNSLKAISARETCPAVYGYQADYIYSDLSYCGQQNTGYSLGKTSNSARETCPAVYAYQAGYMYSGVTCTGQQNTGYNLGNKYAYNNSCRIQINSLRNGTAYQHANAWHMWIYGCDSYRTMDPIEARQKSLKCALDWRVQWQSHLLGNKAAHVYNGNIYKCDDCGKHYKTEAGMKNHKCNKCRDCNNVFSSQQRLKSHKCYSKKMPPEDTKCKYCLRLYKTTQGLKNHKCTFCKYCSKIYSTYSNYKVHKCSFSSHSNDQINEQVNMQTSNKENVIIKMSDHEIHKEHEPAMYTTTSGKKIPGCTSFNQNTNSNNNSVAVDSKTNNKKKDLAGGVTVRNKHDELKHFNPVTIQWQLEKCSELKIPLIHAHSFSACILDKPSQVHKTLPDGNCFFRAISYLLTGRECFHIDIRKHVAQHMKANPNIMKKVLPVEQSLESYLVSSEIEYPQKWATHIEIFATANMLKTDIYVYTRYGFELKWIKHAADFLQSSIEPSEKAIYLDHPGQVHYDVVENTSKEQSNVVVSLSKNVGDSLIEQEIQYQMQMSLTKQKQQSSNSLNSTASRKEKNRLFMRKKRKEPVYKLSEASNRHTSAYKEKNKMRMRIRRQNPNIKSAEKVQKQSDIVKEKHRLWKRQARQNITVRNRENSRRQIESYQVRHKIQMRQSRKSITVRNRENLRRHTQSHRSKHRLCQEKVRTNVANRNRENLRRHMESYRLKQRLWRKKYRTNMAIRNKENLRRHMESYRLKHRLWKRQLRTDVAVRYKENLRRHMESYRLKHRLWKRQLRTDVAVRYKENLRRHMESYRLKHRLWQRKLRTDVAVRYKEKLRRHMESYRLKHRLWKRQLRTDVAVRYKENLRRRMESYRLIHRLWQRKLRTDVGVKYKENLRRRMESYRLKHRLWQRKVRKGMDNNKRQNKQKNTSVDTVIKNFHEAVSHGPIYVCTCCDQLWYRNSVKLASGLKCEKGLYDQCIKGVTSADQLEWICNTCSSHIAKGHTPPLAKANNVKFPEKSEKLQLSCLEERLVAPQIPFMQLHELPRGGQISLKGNIVNVPTNINTTTNILPRKASDSACIPLKLKRKLSYEHHYMFQTVRPNRVLDAVKFLVQTSPLYKKEGIQLDNEWTYNVPAEESGKDEGDDKPDSSELFDEVAQEDLIAGNLDTMMQPNDMSEQARQIISVAPGEGNIPLSIFMDQFSEELAFPTIFCGLPRPDNNQRLTSLYYSELCKSELRRRDRRAAGHIPNIFFKMKKLQMKQILDRARLCLRKTRKGSLDVTAGMLKSPETVSAIVNINEGYRVFKDLRGSPPYWEKVKKDLFAMLRQLGIPTWFASFSSAETRWQHLLQILGKTIDNKDYTVMEVSSFDWFQKQRLISSDPVTCARHFDYQVQRFIHDVLKSSAHPVGSILDYFYKVEFQMRGSPHIHMMIWVENSPVMGENSLEDILTFIDQYVSCSDDKDIEDLINIQMHRHSRTCKKKKTNSCRFNFPQPPMATTKILEPLPADYDKTDVQRLKQTWKLIQKDLDALNADTSIDFSQFLQKLSLSEDEYILAVRSSIKCRTVFLRRTPQEIRINCYNKVLIKSWRANMDLQFVIDPFGCAMYIVSYIAKSQRGMSNLMYCACKDAQQGNLDLRKQVQFIGNKFLNNVEVSAQEAVYFILQIPLYKSSRDVIFINTSASEERTVLLKTFDQIQTLPDDSTDVEQKGILEYYAERPQELVQIKLQ